MITLYHAPKSRSSRFIWLLEELGQPYEIELVDIRGERDPAYKAIHPHGKVPAIVHDGVTVFESAAIALYLADEFPAAGLGPKIHDRARGPYLTWLAYYTGVMEPAFVGKALGFTTTSSTTGWAPPDAILAYISAQLARGPYLLGEVFSTADILFGSTFALFKGSPLLPHDPTIAAYTERVTSRPAFVRAAAKDAG